MIARPIAWNTARIGKRTLWQTNKGTYFVMLENRTNRTVCPVPRERVHLWIEKLR